MLQGLEIADLLSSADVGVLFAPGEVHLATLIIRGPWYSGQNGYSATLCHCELFRLLTDIPPSRQHKKVESL